MSKDDKNKMEDLIDKICAMSDDGKLVLMRAISGAASDAEVAANNIDHDLLQSISNMTIGKLNEFVASLCKKLNISMDDLSVGGSGSAGAEEEDDASVTYKLSLVSWDEKDRPSSAMGYISLLKQIKDIKNISSDTALNITVVKELYNGKSWDLECSLSKSEAKDLIDAIAKEKKTAGLKIEMKKNK